MAVRELSVKMIEELFAESVAFHLTVIRQNHKEATILTFDHNFTSRSIDYNFETNCLYHVN